MGFLCWYICLVDGVFITLMTVMSETFLCHDYKEIYSYFVSVLFLPIIFTCMALFALKTVVKKRIMAEFVAMFMLACCVTSFN